MEQCCRASTEVASQKDHEKLKANMSDADKKMWDHFDDWNHRMNQKTKVGCASRGRRVLLRGCAR